MSDPAAPTVWLAVSGHGFGHAAQACAVAGALLELAPRARLVIQGAAPRGFFAHRLPEGFDFVEGELDPGVAMRDSVSVDRDATHKAYLAYHADWEGRLAEQTRLLEASAPDLLLADVPYVSLAAAKGLGIPAFALCSLNWADILDGYFPGDADIARIRDIIRACYQGADAFLAPEPSMPMSWLHNRTAIAPLALLGRNRRGELLDTLGLAEPARLAVLAFGGFDLDVSAAHLPQVDALHWLIQGEARRGRTDITPLRRLPLPFPDILASADALVTKPGYGIFAEAACLGLPVVTVERPDWPETAYLVSWLTRKVPAAVLTRSDLKAGRLPTTLESLWQARRPPEVTPSGAAEAARLLRAACPSAPRANVRSLGPFGGSDCEK